MRIEHIRTGDPTRTSLFVVMTVIFFFFGQMVIYGQIPNWGWVVQAGGSGVDYANGVAVDAWRNVFTLVHHEDPVTGWEAFVFTIPGILGANGLNNRPVSVCVNTLLQLKPCTDGLPVDFVVRGILEQYSFEDAVDFIRTIKHAAGQNYLIGDPDQMGSYECSVSQATEFLPFDGAAFTYHTNHPLSNTNIRESIVEQLEGRRPLPELFTSRCSRFQALQSAYPDNSV